jgi:glycosyltransferase involved in cell wall biosynthesis
LNSERLQLADGDKTSTISPAARLRTILVDLTPLLPGGENGGAKIFVLELLRDLAELAPETQFVLLTRSSSHEELAQLDRANVRRMMMFNIGSRETMQLLPQLYRWGMAHLPGRLRAAFGKLAYSLKRRIKRGGRSTTVLQNLGADLLFCPFTAPSYFVPSIPTVCTIYDLQYRVHPEFFSAADVAQRSLTMQEAMDRSSALVAISEYTRRAALDYGRLDPDKITTIHLQLARRNTPMSKGTSVLNALGLSASGYLIYPANFWKHKNHEMLLTAFGMARRAGLPEEIRLVCTGAPGERQRWLQEASRRLGLENHVLFPGYLSDAELSELMANCAGLIFPSLYEGFGLPIIEAMAAGVPVACSNMTSLPEVAGDAAMLFDPRIPEEVANAIVALINDKARITKLVEAGKRRAMGFLDSKSMARQYWMVFDRVVAAASNQDRRRPRRAFSI